MNDAVDVDNLKSGSVSEVEFTDFKTWRMVFLHRRLLGDQIRLSREQRFIMLKSLLAQKTVKETTPECRGDDLDEQRDQNKLRPYGSHGLSGFLHPSVLSGVDVMLAKETQKVTAIETSFLRSGSDVSLVFFK